MDAKSCGTVHEKKCFSPKYFCPKCSYSEEIIKEIYRELRPVKMKGKRVSFSEIEQSLTRSKIATTRRISLQENGIKNCDMANPKLEKYRNLLAKEYQIRCKLQRAKSDLETRHVSRCCDCGKARQGSEKNEVRVRKYSRKLSYPIINRSIQETPKVRKRPLSADDIELPTYARVRREVALEKARHRRESLQSLEDDFQKLKTIINLTKELTLEQNNNNDTLNTVEEEHTDGCHKNCIRRAGPTSNKF